MAFRSFHPSSFSPQAKHGSHPFDGRFFQQTMVTIVLLVVISCFLHTCHGFCSQLDRDSLLSIKLSVAATPALNWSLAADCCSWEGVGCDDSGRVTELWLPSRGLEGTIPPSILNLTSFSKLGFSQNRLSGNLPDGFYVALNLLQVVDLSHNTLSGGLKGSDKLLGTVRTFNLSSNHFQGTIPSSFFQPHLVLESFDVSNNSFSGSIPSSVCSFSNSIQYLDFSNNHFASPIPHGFGQCSNLQILRAGFNNLPGEIPEDIYGLLKLQELYMPGNSFSGRIDERIVNLIDLRILALNGNDLTGTIPRDIGRLSNLEQLLLHENNLKGTIPPSLTNCTKLMTLNLNSNSLEGELSAFDFSKFVQVQSVDLGSNHFTGELPASLSACKTLVLLNLAVNNLSGEIPPGIAALELLSSLSLSNNSLINIKSAISILSGCKNLINLVLTKNFYDEELPGSESLISSEGFPNLQSLILAKCRLAGSFPLWLSKLDNLTVLDLSYNNLTGCIPGWAVTLPNLFYFDLSNNLISGHFPVEITTLPRLASLQNSAQPKCSSLEFSLFVRRNNLPLLQYQSLHSLPPALYMGNNRITGTIPEAIGQLQFLLALDLSNNDFSGNIPATLSKLTNLEKLDLSGNHLSGEIPASLRNLYFLSSFNVAHNDLRGRIPSGGQFDTFPISSFEGNPGLDCSIQLPNWPYHDEPNGKPRQDIRSENEVIDWVGFEIGFAVTSIFTFLAVLKFFKC